MEKISVIVPVYNGEEYLGECIESILRQTHGDLELIIVDDGSTDGSAEICDEYAGKDKRVKVYHQENGGASRARNLGLEKARGEYVMFVDADDWLEDEALERLSAEIGGSADLVIGNMYMVQRGEKTPKLLGESAAENGEGAFEFMTYNYLWGPIAKLYRKDCLKRGFREGCLVGEDLLFNFENRENFKAYQYIAQPLYNYRKNHSSVTLNSNAERRDSALSAIREIVENTEGRLKTFYMVYYLDVYYSYGHQKGMSDEAAKGYYKKVMATKDISAKKKAKLIVKARSTRVFSAYHKRKVNHAKKN